METKDKGDNTAAKEIGMKLKLLRTERRMTSAAVCEKAGIKAPTLTAIENGYYNVGIRQITEVAAALDAQIAIIPGGRLTHDGIEGIRDFI